MNDTLVSNELKEVLDEVVVLHNEIPKDWQTLLPFKGRTEETEEEYLRLTPHIGAFEIYHKENLLYSKLSTRLWPNCKVLSKKIASYFDDLKAVGNVSKYTVNYQHPRSNSPSCLFNNQ